MTMRTGCTINGKHFRETHSSGTVKYTRRFFVDGKLVSRAVYLAEVKAAKAAEQAAQLDITMKGE